MARQQILDLLIEVRVLAGQRTQPTPEEFDHSAIASLYHRIELGVCLPNQSSMTK